MAKLTMMVMVVKVSMKDPKKRSRVLKTAAGFPGVTSASLQGDRLLVVGAGVDPVALTTKLRKKFGSADLVSVGSWPEKIMTENMENTFQPQPVAMNYWPYQAASIPQLSYPNQYHYEAYHEPSCSIM